MNQSIDAQLQFDKDAKLNIVNDKFLVNRTERETLLRTSPVAANDLFFKATQFTARDREVCEFFKLIIIEDTSIGLYLP